MELKAKGGGAMRRLVAALLLCGGAIGRESIAQAESGNLVAHSDLGAGDGSDHAELNAPSFRGWGFLANKLLEDGISVQDVESVFLDPRFPEFTPVPFQLKPKETAQMYVSFTQDRHIKVAREFLDRYRAGFLAAEKKYGVSRYVVAAIILVETYCGKNVGDQLVAYRLARVSSVGDPQNLAFNLEQQREADPAVTMDDVRERARYLEETFYPEFRAIFELRHRYEVDVLGLKGSSAGAFGLPQFLPQSFLRFAVDGDGDGHTSLFSPPDAIFSTAHFLSHQGWRDSAPLYDKKRALWAYNRSDAYGDAVLKVSIRLHEGQKTSHKGTASGSKLSVQQKNTQK